MAGSNVVGLDIGSNQIKAVHLERRRSQWNLANVGIVPTPPNSVQDGMLLDIPAVTEAVRQLVRNYKIPLTDTVAAVSGTHVLVRPIKVPEMSVAALRKSIRFEAAKHIDQGTSGVSIENSAVEFEILGKSGDPPQLDVLLVVAPMPMVASRVAVMEAVGMDPVAVDVEAFALLRAMDAARLLPPAGQAAVMMNMGATYTDLNIVVGTEMAVPRSIPVGGNMLTQNLASLLNVPADEAELHKRTLRVANQGPDALDMSLLGAMETSYGGVDPVKQVVQPFLDELVRELRRSVLYFQSQAAEAGMNISVERLVMAGGGTLLEGVPPYLRERLEMEVTLLDPLSEKAGAAPATAQWHGRGPELAVALGLALKEYV